MIIYRKSEIPEHLQQYFQPTELGLERTPEEYVAKMVEVFREVRRVLRDDGTLWLNLGDSYANNGVKNPESVGGFTGERIRMGGKGHGSGYMDSRPREIPHGCKPKDLVGIPWMVAFAFRADGWYLRQDIIWHKPNPMPESVTDRCTKSHEYLFLLTKSAKYHYDAEAIKENTNAAPDVRLRKSTFNKQGNVGGHHNGAEIISTVGRNKRSVWTINTQSYPGAHFATFPEKLVEPCILAGSKQGDIVLDPFIGSGTTAVVAKRLFRNYIGIELNPEYIKLAEKRIPRHVQRRL